jgi:hypothetical protein
MALRQSAARQLGFKPLLLALFVQLFQLALIQDNALGQIIQTGSSGVYQNTDGRLKVILSHKDGAQGIFVAYFKEGVPPQEFNPERAPASGATHIFVRFNPVAEHQYSDVLVGDQSYKVSGNLNIWLTENGSVSVNIDNMNPYLTVTQRETDGRNDALIGFYGMTEVVKGSGNLAAILTANQLSPEIAKIVKPYVVGPKGLQLNGKEVTAPALGIFLKQEHDCLKQDKPVAILTLKQLKAIQATKPEAQQAKLLESYLKENQTKSPLLGHLILRAEKSGPMILLNIATKDIFDMRSIKNAFSNRKICVISPIS